MPEYDLSIIGGGAAGFFAAIRFAELNPEARIAIFEKKGRTLEKVKISGGGRCNVTHHWNKPEDASNYYPRGASFLQHAFSLFHCADMVAWLKQNGIKTNIESDGRIFPASNDSQTIIDCFSQNLKKHGIRLFTQDGLSDFKLENGLFHVQTDGGTHRCRNLLIASGSNRKVWDLLKLKGHTIPAPVASLFTFQFKQKEWNDLAGIAIPNSKVELAHSAFKSDGPLLITHKGLSGPAILKLSAWAARELEKRNYQFTILVNWSGVSPDECLTLLKELRDSQAKSDPSTSNPFRLPKRLNRLIFEQSGITTQKMAELGNKQLQKWADLYSQSKFEIEGKIRHKEEFVTCGGIDLSEVDPYTMESKLIPGLYFAGEVLDIDAITGGFNFQACWSEANLIAQSIQL